MSNYGERYDHTGAAHKLADPDEGPLSLDEGVKMPGPEPEPIDPFDDPVALAQLQFITSLRIYDVLFSLLDEQNSEKAEFIADLHRAGGFLMSSPRFTAHFVDDAVAGESLEASKES